MTEQIVVSWSEISSRRACPHKHHLEYRKRWTKAKPLNSALGKGVLFHKVLEAYYLGRKNNKSLAECYALGQDVIDAVPVESEYDEEAIQAVQWMYDGYHEQYYGDSLWRVKAVEHRFKVRLPVVVAGQPDIWLKGSIDLVVQDEKNRLIVIDHKTGAALPKPDQAFELSDQFGLYLWALKQLKTPVWAAMHNAIKSKMNKGDIPGEIERWEVRKAAGEKPGVKPKKQLLEDRFARRNIVRTALELDTLAREAAATAADAYMHPEFNQRTPNEDVCRYMCSFREPCLDGRKMGKEWELVRLKEENFVQDFQRH